MQEAFGSSVLTHKKEQQIKIEGEFKPTVDCLCATRRRLIAVLWSELYLEADWYFSESAKEELLHGQIQVLQTMMNADRKRESTD